jgi:hypothetical protein
LTEGDRRSIISIKRWVNTMSKEEIETIEIGHAPNMVVPDPFVFDFSTGFSDTWLLHEAARCSECNAVLTGYSDIRHKDADPFSDCGGLIPEYELLENLVYPVFDDIDPETLSKLLVDYPFAVVSFPDKKAPEPVLGLVLCREVGEGQRDREISGCYYCLLTYHKLLLEDLQSSDTGESEAGDDT